jgi:5-methylcytosine-specific restriction enzyme subunit McrC
MAIPVQNIYYLLSYAWNDFESGELVDVESLDSTELVDLFAHVLIEGTSHLLRRGLDREYRTFSQEIAGVRGQIDFNTSLRKMLFQQGKAQCRVDELTHDVLHNRLLRSTLLHLGRLESLDKVLREKVRRQVRHFRGVSELPRLNPLLFHRVRLHRNNRVYRLLLNVCELIARNLLVNHESGEMRFRDVIRDDTNMPMLFEKFVRNFYKREHPEFRARAEHINWNAEPANEEAAKFLPIMKTDTTLRGDGRVIIIDTKYYKNTLQKGRFGDSVKSANLYQLFAYLKNFEATKDFEGELEGMLLYPVIDREYRLEYQMDGHRVRVCTVDLVRPWQAIHEELLELVAF